MGWLLDTQGMATKRRYAPELLEDPVMRKINNAFLPLVALGLITPGVLGFALTGTVAGAATGVLWGGFVRVFLTHHVTWSINSVCHFYGRRRFETDDYSTNVAWLAIPSLGESWHHNHHAFPRAAQQGLRWYEVDISGAVIAALERFGLAWDVVRISPERQQARLAGAAAPRRARFAEATD
jgi:stearoyl-CoA desaturase (delta-9 desaturase)